MPRSKAHAAAIRRLDPCEGHINQGTANIGSCCPSWGLQALGPSYPTKHQRDVFDSGLQGQAVLTLPLQHADLTVKLPPGLQLGATPAGHLDCRMQLLGVQLDWPATTGGGPARSQHEVLPARSSAAAFACRSGALLLAHALFPDHTHHLLTWLAVPVAAADALGLLAAATPAEAQEAVRSKAQRLKATLQRRGIGPQDSSRGVGWVDGVQGVVEGSLHTLRCLSGPAAVVATGSWLWGLVSPSSHMLCSAMVALLAVAADYNSLGRDVARGRIPPGKAVEAAWRARHKAAAQRLAVYCNDLPASPPLAPLINLASCCSIAAGLAVGGQGLLGQLPLSLTGPAASALTSDWPPGASAGRGRAGGVADDRLQLVLAGSMVHNTGGNKAVHEAAGLSRAQLLELFTGSSEDPLSRPASAASPDAACDAAHSAGVDVQQGAVVTAGEPAAETAAALVGAAPGAAAWHGSDRHTAQLLLTQANTTAAPPAAAAATAGSSASASAGSQLMLSLPAVAQAAPGIASPSQVPTDTASERSVDAVVRVRQPARQDKPGPRHDTTTSSSSSSSNHLVTQLSRTSSGISTAPAAPAAGRTPDPLAFLDHLPLYGQQDHTHVLALQAAAAAGQADGADSSLDVALSAEAVHHWHVVEGLQLCVRAVYLLLVFSPFVLLGAPMLLMSWWLLTRAAAAQHQRVTPHAPQSSSSSSNAGTLSITDSSMGSSSKLGTFEAGMQRVRQVLLQQPSELALQALQQLWQLLVVLCALLDLLLVLLLGGHWAAGVSAWESAGMWLRKQAWLLLHFSCSKAGAAFIKWGQWSSSRRDIFPADFCDALSVFHDRAPVHSFRHSRRQIKAALGVEVEALFDNFDPTPLASGSIAQVHRATLKPTQYRQYIGQQQLPGRHGQQQQQQVEEEQGQQVVVKVCHPNVAEHIRLDFKLVGWLSAAASKLPVLRGLPLRESVAQFSHTMTAQTDLRVEAVHALRFYNNFAGVKSSVTIPRPIPGLVSSTVLVESFEKGQSVAVFMREPHTINTQIVALGVDAYLKMLLSDNFVHTDLHPGNILFRSVPARQSSRKQQEQRQQQHDHGSSSFWQRLRRFGRPGSNSSSSSSTGDAAVGPDGQAAAGPLDAEVPQWERELQELSAAHQQRWVSRHGPPVDSGSSSVTTSGRQAVSAEPSDSASSSSSDAPESAQLVLLDFGLAEELTPLVRFHFTAFLHAISAGNGLAAAAHLLRWSGHQACPDKQAFANDMVDLFQAACDIHSQQGIDLDYVMTAVLGLARKHGVTIDSCYASLVISVCVLVGFAKALDPEVNLMDAATPTLLAYALTGKVVGRLYS